MRANSGMRTPPPPTLNGFADFFHTRTAAPFSVPMQQESDAQCWERMLALQREYHCYKSARLEAAVEALERGCSIEDVPMRKWPAQSLYISVVWRLTDYNSIEAVPRSPERRIKSPNRGAPGWLDSLGARRTSLESNGTSDILRDESRQVIPEIKLRRDSAAMDSTSLSGDKLS
jgi:hypothetical protein